MQKATNKKKSRNERKCAHLLCLLCMFLDVRLESGSDVQSAELSVTGAQSVCPGFIEERGGEI